MNIHLKTVVAVVNVNIQSIFDLYKESDHKLTIAKSELSSKELDKYFDDYRKDKKLISCYVELFRLLIKYINIYLFTNTDDNLDKLEIYLTHVLEFHHSSIVKNKNGRSNAIIHFSSNGNKLINSFDFTKILIVRDLINTSIY